MSEHKMPEKPMRNKDELRKELAFTKARIDYLKTMANLTGSFSTHDIRLQEIKLYESRQITLEWVLNLRDDLLKSKKEVDEWNKWFAEHSHHNPVPKRE